MGKIRVNGRSAVSLEGAPATYSEVGRVELWTPEGLSQTGKVFWSLTTLGWSADTQTRRPTPLHVTASADMCETGRST